MQLVFHCPQCNLLHIEPVDATHRGLNCSACDWKREFPADHLDGETPRRCLACGTEDLWRQKDFPQGLGLLMVVTGASLSTLFYWYVQPAWAIGVLLVFAAIDLALYAFMPDVLVCYRCKTRHRKATIDDQHRYFDLEVNERYRQEAIRLAAAEKTPPQ